MDELVADPIGGVARIYRSFGWELDGETRRRMEAYVAAHLRHRHGVHRYDGADFGLDAGTIRDRFSFYYKAYDIAV